MLLAPVLAVVDGEEEKTKFIDFYNKYAVLVMFISLKRLHDFHLAEENCQEVFFSLAKNFDKVGEIDSPETKGYVYTVANGLAINKFNKEVVRQPKKEKILFLTDISDETFDLYNETEIKSAVEALTDEEKSYLRLKYLYGYTSKEIGEMYGESPSNVRRKLQIIKKKLAERLDEENE